MHHYNTHTQMDAMCGLFFFSFFCRYTYTTAAESLDSLIHKIPEHTTQQLFSQLFGYVGIYCILMF